MKSTKKVLFSSIIAVLACVSITAATVFANTSSTPAPGYGTLTGTLSGQTYVTSVTQNSDNAYLTIKGSMQDQNGNTVVDTQEIRSSRGETRYSGSWSSVPSNVYVIYGTHGVQGGSRYGAAAVYTFTHR
ncbi:hypothetical protein SAMN05421736_1341 [Evansella caseinilytica]|uniref:Uncharacterized protein n=1 Tax=Evansella caseinilytica TaxID=1503961 RepID=A0A1H3V0S4_9BACI|nr:hypothetical protein [Evansella caseinilytica]SDZ68313.1 hypothetical protein SAMN05421736_1341 [Evansella caseinilytica]